MVGAQIVLEAFDTIGRGVAYIDGKPILLNPKPWCVLTHSDYGHIKGSVAYAFHPMAEPNREFDTREELDSYARLMDSLAHFMRISHSALHAPESTHHISMQRPESTSYVSMQRDISQRLRSADLTVINDLERRALASELIGLPLENVGAWVCARPPVFQYNGRFLIELIERRTPKITPTS